MAPRETENNAHAKFWGDKQRELWYAMVFSVVVGAWWLSILVHFNLAIFAKLKCRQNSM